MKEKRLNPMPKNLMLALDIGTRSVVGVISKLEGKQYVIEDMEVLEHPDRAMFDGQIHDIQKVTDIVRTVVERLEERNGYKLEQAAIAAAGRALKTKRAEVEIGLDVIKEIDKVLTDNLEMQAIQLAQKILAEDGKLHSQYYCVGYSVIQYHLDGAMILNPVGHRGNLLKVDIIATFLPHIVVDSLYSVVQKAGLEVMNLTLEPIAAINVAIPQNLRLLNLALVDVGAGTSDIAISKDGSVVSYGMVSVAGDEITEKIAQTYLLDFNGAEKLKTALCYEETNTFKDILGLEHTIDTTVILSQIEDTIKNITGEVAKSILSLNKKPPSAVFCIGGGALIPGFTAYLAEALGLPPERVVIKAVEGIDRVVFNCAPVTGPEFITPIGIGVTAFEERDQDFIQVNVNDTTVRLFHTKPLQVSDALLLAGFNARSLISERGPSYFVKLDGNDKEIRGEYGEPAKIYINGALSALDSKISHKDQITVIAALKGQPRKIELRELVAMESKITLNGEVVKTLKFVSVNGVHRTGEYRIIEGDTIETVGIKTVRELAESVELDLNQYEIILDHCVLTPEDEISNGKVYHFEPVATFEREVPKKRDDTLHAFETLQLIVNGKPLAIHKTKESVVFVDVFDHIDFDLSKPQGILNLKLNGERARYTDVLKSGDAIDIQWKK